ncbi:hypothetical protein V494_04918 [Pseudogymnoascus sp. VKM F-4513 (FW-928)]|nr:hypothetical protein V494_04918 [Pseudogymnoascus sp. VKM F-4513 (FW-928)]
MGTNSTSLPQQYSIFKKMSFIKFFMTFAVLASHVLAGSRIWQPQVLAKFDRGASTSPLERRYFIIDETSSSVKKNHWKNGQIRYCYESEEAKTILDKDVKKAFEVWSTAGLDDISMAPAGEVECRENPYTVLHIIYTTGTLSTFVGFPWPNNEIYKEPGKLSMRLSDRTDIGNLDKIGNYAHELGHALGLFHEHQNPAFWRDVNDADRGTDFGPNNFNCQNLNDYDEAQRKFQIKYPLSEMADTLCISRTRSNEFDFSASDFLPLQSEMGKAHEDGGVDWDSIMIYNSGVGGRIDPSIPGDDKRLPVLLKNDGSRIQINNAPSTQDIAGVSELYPKKPASSKEVLHQKGSTSTMRTFMERFNLSKKKGGKGGGSSGCL